MRHIVRNHKNAALDGSYFPGIKVTDDRLRDNNGQGRGGGLLRIRAKDQNEETRTR